MSSDDRERLLASLSPAKRALFEKRLRERAAGIGPRPDRSRLPLSFAQSRLHFVDRLAGGDPFYNVPSAIELRGPLDAEALRAAFDRVLERHEVLRASFHDEGGVVTQRVAPALSMHLPRIPVRDRDEALARAHAEARRPFDLSVAPLLRAELLAIGPEHHVLVTNHHHIVADGWSTALFLRDLGAAYAGVVLPPLPIQYADYAHWQRSTLDPARAVAFFREALDGAAPLLDLPTDRPRPAEPTFAGADVHVDWPAPLAEAVRTFARAEVATPFMVLLAAFQALLGKLAGTEDVVVGASVAGRDRVELEGLIGFFVNIVVLRADLRGDPSFADLVGRVRERTLASFAHRDLPFDELARALAPPRDLGHTPLFQVNFVLQNAPDAVLSLPGLDVRALPVRADSARFDLVLSMEEGPRGISGTFTYRTDLFERETIERLEKQLRQLLEAALASPATPLSRLLVDAPRVASTGDSPAPDLDRGAHTLIGVTDRVAIRHGETVTTYAALDARANAIAHHLRASGVGRGSRVAIATARIPDRIAAVLGVWKAGAAFVPIDLGSPLARAVSMLEDAGVRVALADDAGEGLLPASIERVIDLSDPVLASRSNAPLDVVVSGDDEAYVIFTSGSTARPKGVSIPHRGIVNLARAQITLFGITAEDRVLQFAPFGFDASVSEMMMALAAEATLDLGDPGEETERDLAAELRARGISVVTLPPSLLRELDPTDLPALRVVISAGEACDPGIVRRWGQGRAFFNAYGPTEASVCATIHRATEDDAFVPIGRALPNVSVSIVGAHGEPVPTGGWGEIAIGGVGVGHYLGQATPAVHLTGDRGRDRGDGVILFGGRQDDRIKLRGHRIDPGEVEAALLSHPDVQEAAVALRVRGAHPLLVAWVVGEAEDLPSFLKARLPSAMIPGQIVVVDAIPRTTSGKLDRKALSLPSLASREAERPLTEAETTLARIWQELLGLERVGVTDNFFAVGGDSIASLKLVARAAAAGLALKPKSVFEHQTIEALARHAERTQTPASARPSTGDGMPLSPLQEGMLFHALYEPENRVYVSQLRFTIHGAFDVARLRAAWETVVRRHPALRTTFAWEGRPRPVQIVHPEIPLPFVMADDDDRRGFDLVRGPLFRLVLARRSEIEHELIWTHHHLVVDGWSVATVLAEVQALASTPEASLPPARPFRDYIDWLATVDRSGDDAFFRDALAGAVPITLPTGKARREVTRTEEITIRLPLAPIVEAARRAAITPSTLVVGAWGELLGRLTGASAPIVGVTVAGRPPAFLDDAIVGLFINTLPVKVEREQGPASQWLARLQRDLAALREHEHVSLSTVHGYGTFPKGEPLFESVVVYENYPASTSHGLPISNVRGVEQTSLPLTIVAAPEIGVTEDAGARLELRLAYDADRFEAAAMHAILGDLATLVSSLAAQIDDAVPEVPHLDQDTRRARLLHARGPKSDAPPQTIIDLVRRAPEDATALVFEGRSLTYGQLLRAASGFAGTIEAGQTIAVCIERSPALVVAMLGVWLAGATVVPLDPSHPSARLAHQLEAACADRLIVSPKTSLRALSFAGKTPVAPLDTSGPEVTRAPSHVAYVLFTSGSTGRPKGVAVSHAALANYLAWARGSYDASSSLLHTSIAVDLTLTSALLPLAAGGVLVLGSEGATLAETLRAHHARGPLGLLKMTPSHLALLVADGYRGPLARSVVLGGERLDPELVRAARRLDPEAHLVDEYGPTEACIGCAAGPPGELRPIANMETRVVDAAGEPCGPGIVGEIVILGPGVAEGYLGGPAFGGVYRTGDRGTLRDGILTCLGRTDDQIKIRGHRIELGEIEGALLRHPDVRAAAVVHHEGRLVAFVVSSASTGELAGHLEAELPSAFQPNEIRAVSVLPLGPSGKIDRAALAPEATRAPPETEVERSLAAIWREVLGRDAGRDDDFFALGGDSILALHVMSRAASVGLAVGPKQLFEHRTLRAVAQNARAVVLLPRTRARARAPEEGHAALTPIQRWFFGKNKKNPSHYNQSVLFAGEDAIDARRFEEAFVATLDHHRLTRTRFTGGLQVHGGEPWRPSFTRFDLTEVDDVRPAIEAHANAAQRALDLGSGRLAHALLLDLGRGRGFRALVVVHHLLVDAVSWRPLLDDFREAYAHGDAAVLAPVTVSFLAWSRDLEGRSFEAERPYWTSVAAPLPPLPLPPPGTNGAARLHRSSFDARLVQTIAARASCRVHELLLATLAQALGAWSGRGEVAIDVEGHGREPADDAPLDLSRTVGWFTAIHPVRLGPDRADNRDRIRAVPGGGLGFGMLDLRSPAQVSFNYLGRLDPLEGVFGRAAESRGDDEGPDEQRAYAVEINGFTAGAELVLEWAFDHDADVPALAAQFEQLLVADDPPAPLSARASSPHVPAQDELLLPLARGRGPGLFLFAPVGGRAGCYAPLAERLDARVYGLEAEGLDRPAPLLETIEAMAARACDAIRTSGVEAPIVGGWSMGALVALEAARILGAPLVVIDQIPSEIAPAPSDLDLLAEITRDLVGTEPPPEASFEARLRWLVREAARRELPLGEDQIRRHVRVCRTGFRALAAYEPRPIEGRALVLAASRDDGGAEWAALAKGGVTFVRVPGDHLSILRPPHVDAVAQALRIWCT